MVRKLWVCSETQGPDNSWINLKGELELQDFMLKEAMPYMYKGLLPADFLSTIKEVYFGPSFNKDVKTWFLEFFEEFNLPTPSVYPATTN